MLQNKCVLSVKNLSISFSQYVKGLKQKTITPVRALDFQVNQGEVHAIIGASGSGKSLLAHAILGILPYNAICYGKMSYMGEPLTEKRKEMLRGKEIAFIPQSVNYLDPLMNCLLYTSFLQAFGIPVFVLLPAHLRQPEHYVQRQALQSLPSEIGCNL